MAYEGTISKGCETEFRGVYLSESVKVGRLVAYCIHADEDTGSGTGFGFNVQYPTASTSLICGSVYNPNASNDGYSAGDVCTVIRRGYVKDFMSYGTSTLGHAFMGHTSLGLGLGLPIGGAAVWTQGICGTYLEQDAGTATTTANAFVNCWA